jgi:hypothetical protein
MFSSGLYATDQFEPGWLLLLPVTFAIAWYGTRSSFPTFAALLYPGADPRRAKRVFAISHSVGLVVAVGGMMTGWAMLHYLAQGRPF